jgi:hypothetical protein
MNLSIISKDFHGKHQKQKQANTRRSPKVEVALIVIAINFKIKYLTLFLTMGYCT